MVCEHVIVQGRTIFLNTQFPFVTVCYSDTALQSRGMMSTMFVQRKQGVTVDDLRNHLDERFSVSFQSKISVFVFTCVSDSASQP